jgi:sulfate adenylyltransferase subunit 1 (EFTu-like GTPase family)
LKKQIEAKKKEKDMQKGQTVDVAGIVGAMQGCREAGRTISVMWRLSRRCVRC